MDLIAEDMLLLLLDDRKGKVVGTTHPQTVLGGAVLIELAMVGAVTVDERESGLWRQTKVRVVPGVVPDDEILRTALAIVGEKVRSAQDLVTRLGKGLKEELCLRLERRRTVRRQQDRVAGLFPRTRWPAADPTYKESLRAALSAALVQGVTPEPRTAALISLLSAIDRAQKIVDRDGLPAGQVRKRAKEIAQGEWAAKAVRDSIAASTAAVTAAVTASIAASAATSGG
jgi:hypothetical protein